MLSSHTYRKSRANFQTPKSISRAPFTFPIMSSRAAAAIRPTTTQQGNATKTSFSPASGFTESESDEVDSYHAILLALKKRKEKQQKLQGEIRKKAKHSQESVVLDIGVVDEPVRQSLDRVKTVMDEVKHLTVALQRHGHAATAAAKICWTAQNEEALKKARTKLTKAMAAGIEEHKHAQEVWGDCLTRYARETPHLGSKNKRTRMEEAGGGGGGGSATELSQSLQGLSRLANALATKLGEDNTSENVVVSG